MSLEPHRFVAALLMLAAPGLAGCPDVPRTPFEEPVDATDGDAPPGDVDAFVPLALTRVHENLGEPAGGERVSIFGEGMIPGAGGTIVTFGGVPATGVLVLDANQLNCDVPPHEPGLVDVRVDLPDGQSATMKEAYLYRGPLRLDAISPGAGSVRGGGEAIVEGEAFDEDTRILVGGRLLEDAVLVDDGTIRGKLPSRLAGSPGPVSVVATNGFEQRTLLRAFRYVDDLAVSKVRPAAGTRAGGSLVTLEGTALDPETTIRFAGVLAETVVAGDGGAITVRTPPGAPGPVDVEVSGVLGTLVLERGFVYLDPEASGALDLVNAWPTAGPASGGTRLSLTVLGLDPGDFEVRIDGVEAEVVQVLAAEGVVVVETPSGEPGAATLEVVSGGESSVRTSLFAYQPDLAVDSVSPGVGPVQGGHTATLEGLGFSAASRVFFGFRESPEVKLLDPGRLLVEVPAGVAGRVDVRVEEGGRAAVRPAGHHYRAAAPRLLAVDPPDGARSGGRLVRLFGEGLDGFEGPVLFGAAAAEDVVPIDDATVHLRAPRGRTGSVVVDAGAPGRLAMAWSWFDPRSGFGGTWGGTIPEDLNVTVLDAVTRDPVPLAFVILWDDVGGPYEGTTDDRGQVTFSDAGFGPQQMVTATKDGYTTASIVDFDARNATLFLIPIVPAPPGGGAPPGGVPLPPGGVAGDVLLYEKYVIPPPGSCEAKLALGGGVAAPESPDLCQPCVADLDCGETAVCTALGEQGGRCTSLCGSTAECPAGFTCLGVGFGDTACVPSPGARKAMCAVTRADVFAPEDSVPLDEMADQTAYELLEVDPGEHAVVCFGGWTDPDSGVFVPVRMGVRRHVFVPAGEVLQGQDVPLDVPLDRTMRIRLDEAPQGEGEARNHEVDVFLDLGSDGVFPMPERGSAVDQLAFELPHFPEVLEGSLYDATYTVYARASTDAAVAGLSNATSHALHQDVPTPDDAGLYRVFDGGAELQDTGLASDVLAMHGAGDGFVWAVGTGGRIQVWDGTWWGLHESPAAADLRAVFSPAPGDVWAAGDDGTLLRYGALVWKVVPVPEPLASADFRALHGQLGRLFALAGDGLWTFEEATGTWTEIEIGFAKDLHAIWSASKDELWVAGENGRFRRLALGPQPGEFELEMHDVPGPDLLAIDGSHTGDVWAVGRRGRVVHWDGAVAFEYLAKTRSDLHAVHAADPVSVRAAGDSGTLLRWDGERWLDPVALDHVDLRAVRSSNDGTVVAGGRPTLVVGPFLRLPASVNPVPPDASVNPAPPHSLEGLEISWWNGDSAPEDFTFLQLTEAGGFPFWMLMVAGGRSAVPLPDLHAAWAVYPLWFTTSPGEEALGFVRILRVRMPGFDIDAHDNTMLNQSLWRAWAQTDVPVSWPEPIVPAAPLPP